VSTSTTPTPAAISPSHLRESLEGLRLEREAIHLYDGLAAIEKAGLAPGFRSIAADERRPRRVGASPAEPGPPAERRPDPLRVRFVL